MRYNALQCITMYTNTSLDLRIIGKTGVYMMSGADHSSSSKKDLEDSYDMITDFFTDSDALPNEDRIDFLEAIREVYLIWPTYDALKNKLDTLPQGDTGRYLIKSALYALIWMQYKKEALKSQDIEIQEKVGMDKIKHMVVLNWNAFVESAS